MSDGMGQWSVVSVVGRRQGLCIEYRSRCTGAVSMLSSIDLCVVRGMYYPL